MNPHLDSSSALSLLKKSDLETFVFELLDFLCANKMLLFWSNEQRTKVHLGCDKNKLVQGELSKKSVKIKENFRYIYEYCHRVNY